MKTLAFLGLGIFLISFNGNSEENKRREFPVSIVVLAKDGTKTIDEERAEKFVSILNDSFRDTSGDKVFTFFLKRFATLAEMKIDSCKALTDLGVQTVKPDKDYVYKVFDACHDQRIADQHAINVYIFQSSWDNDESRKSSRIYFHAFRPFIFMNIDRLDNDWSVWAHEFGHAFGLTEIPACGSTSETDTNYMGNQFDICDGTGGNRRIAFYTWQVLIMKMTAKIVENRLAL